MLDGYEQRIMIGYIQRLLTDSRLTAQGLREIGSFLEANTSFLTAETGDDQVSELIDRAGEELAEKYVSKSALRSIVADFDQHLSRRYQELKGKSVSLLQKNLTALSADLDLNSLERDFLGLLTRYSYYDRLQGLLNDLTRCNFEVLDACAICLTVERRELSDILRSSSRLIASGVLRPLQRSGKDLDDIYGLPDAVINALHKSNGQHDDLRNNILGEPKQASLHLDDYEHLGESLIRLADFLRAAVAHQIPGVNILLWGAPGTGKTELCKTLAEHLGMNLYAVGEQDDEGGEPTRRERIGYLQLAQNLLRYQRNSLLMFDEMDDLFEGSAMARAFGAKPSMGSKVFTNRLLEQTPVPTLWIINDAELLDAAIVRRMSLAIELKIPPTHSRERFWVKALDKHAVTLPGEEIQTLARLDISPAIVESAARVAKQIGGKMEDFQFATQGLVKVLSGQIPPSSSLQAQEFHLELMNTDVPLKQLMEQIQRGGQRNFSLCLYGPPGTGKSAFVRHLADTLQMPVLLKRASDLLNAYVGGTEQRIAAAFREAQDKEAFLIFDEVDSLLSDRRYAQRNWEVSQVNEMLTWMEQHSLPFACTTNLMERIDQASLRRFTFKCHCDYLSHEQLRTAFAHFFAIQPEAEALRGIAGLTPGDFALVQKKADILGCSTLPELLPLLRQEADKKTAVSKAPIGFLKS